MEINNPGILEMIRKFQEDLPTITGIPKKYFGDKKEITFWCNEKTQKLFKKSLGLEK